MNAGLWLNDITISGEIAAVGVRTQGAVSDRSFRCNFPENLTQEWIDELILHAHFVAPVWADYAIVRDRPDIWGLGAYAATNIEDGFVFVADDSLVITCNNRVEILITATPIAGEGALRYQIGFHCLAMSADAFFFAMSFRDLCQAHGLLAYPDSRLIEELGLWQTGRGVEAYIEHADRTRPLFVLQRPANLPTAAREFQRAIRVIYSGFGPVIVNDLLFKRYRSGLENPKFGAIGIAPGGAPFPLDRQASSIPLGFYELIGACALGVPPAIADDCGEVGRCAMSAWNPSGIRPPNQSNLHEMGVEFRARWQLVFNFFEPPIDDEIDDEIDAAVVADPSPVPQPKDVAKPITLDGDGQRPAFDRLMQMVTRKEIDLIACWSVDRLGRSLQHLVTFLGEINERGVDLYLHTQGLDTSTPAGRAMFGMLSVFSNFERELIKSRILAGLQRSTKKSGRPPLDPDKVAKIQRTLRSGLSINATAKRLKVGVGTVHRIKVKMAEAA